MKKFLVLGLVWLLALSCASLPTGYERVEKGSNIIYRYDKFRDITWYDHKDNYYYYFYFGESKDGFNPRLVFKYYGGSWIWFNKVIFYCDKKRLNINLKDLENKSEVLGSEVLERYDIHLSNLPKGTLDKIYSFYKSCSQIELRLTGESSATRKIKESQRLALIETYEFYQKKLKESKKS